jgi:ADP-L-glycero-D-manno-heptose 6-epimerase
MIVITGGAGFIGSNLVKFLNNIGFTDIIVVDSLEKENKFANLDGAVITDFINYKKGTSYIYEALKYYEVEVIFHLGANTDVLVKNGDVMLEQNFEHSKFWVNFAIEKNADFIYSSSSAVYGNSKKCIPHHDFEHPLNPYAFSKLLFDNYIRKLFREKKNGTKIVGYRFFNVFGLGEFHKGKNASIPYRFFRFIKDDGIIELFNEDIKRDYVFVEDVCRVLYTTWQDKRIPSGIYNLGSGDPIAHMEIAKIVIQTMQEQRCIDASKDYDYYIKLMPLPIELKDRFQFFTKAEDIPYWVSQITQNVREKIKKYIEELCRRSSEW